MDDVWYPGGTVTEDNAPGIWYRDQVPAMQGAGTACDGRYAPMLVPYSVVREKSEDSGALGYGNVRFCDRLYTARLRLEKLDSETHENILHEAPYFVFMRLSAMMQSKETEVFFFTKPIPRSADQRNF